MTRCCSYFIKGAASVIENFAAAVAWCLSGLREPPTALGPQPTACLACWQAAPLQFSTTTVYLQKSFVGDIFTCHRFLEARLSYFECPSEPLHRASIHNSMVLLPANRSEIKLFYCYLPVKPLICCSCKDKPRYLLNTDGHLSSESARFSWKWTFFMAGFLICHGGKKLRWN